MAAKAIRLVHDHTCDVETHRGESRSRWWFHGDSEVVYRDAIGRRRAGGLHRWQVWRCAWARGCKGELLVHEDWIADSVSTALDQEVE